MATDPGAGDLSAVRSLYLATASVAADLVEHPAVRAGWDRPSLLDRMTVAELAGHLGRSLLQVETFLEAGDPGTPAPVTAELYYAALTGADDLDSDLNVGVRSRARDVAADGPQGVAGRVRGCLDRLTVRLHDEPATRQVRVFGGHAMTLEEYLRTRLVELCVHVEDLALSVRRGPGVDLPDDVPDLPDDALGEAVTVLVGAARHRHGNAAVLRALSRRERDAVGALRVL